MTHDPGGFRGWTRVHCPLPADPGQADKFLTTMLAPVLNGMADEQQLDCWFFERCVRHTVRLHVRNTDRSMLNARLTGLVFAALGPHARIGAAGPPESVENAFDADRDPDLTRRSTALALEIIAATPTRLARVRAAVDLTIATVIGMRLRSADGLAWLAPWPASTDAMTWLMGARSAGAPTAAGHGERWRRVSEVLQAGSGHLARWAGCLADLGGPAAPEPASALHRLLNNQLGLRHDDEWRIYGTLVMSLPGKDVRPPGPRAGARIRCAHGG